MSSGSPSSRDAPAARLRLVCLVVLLLVVAAGMITPVAASTQPTVSVTEQALGSNDSKTVDVSLSHTPDGLAGYAIEVTVADETTATVTDATPAPFARTTTSIDNNTVTFIGADLDRDVGTGAENVSLGSITVAGEQSGSTAVTVDVIRIDTLDGDRLDPRTDPGRVVVTDSESVTVASDGNGDFESIQAAIDAVPAGYTIAVEGGTYDEAVRIEKNLTVRGQAATLRGTNTGADTAVTIGTTAEPVLTGFTFHDWRTGVDATNTSGDWQLSAATMNDVDIGINAGSTRTTVGPTQPATGNWTVANLTIKNPGTFGVIAEESTGDWTIEQSAIQGGMYVAGATGDWIVSNGTVSNDPDVSRGLSGIWATSTSGDWLVENVTVENAQIAGIWARGSSGNWTLRDATVKNVVRYADAPFTAYAGVAAFETSGNWRVVESRLVATGGTGIYARQTRGDWTVSETVIAGNDGPGISVVNSDGMGTVTDSAFVRNSGPDIDASGSEPQVDASGNWWADSSDERCLGATCDAPLDTPPVDIPETLVVDTSSSGEYDSIAAAVENASHGDRILVRNGTYNGSITLTNSIDITAANPGQVTITNATDGDAGITFKPGAMSGATIDGLVVSGFQTGVNAVEDNGAWMLRNMTIRNSNVGVNATSSSGGWAITRSRITDTGTAADAQNAGTASLPVRIRTSQIVNNSATGVNAVNADPVVDATRNWWGDADGPTDGQCVGNIDCDAQLLDPNGTGVTITVNPDGTADYRTIGGAIAAATDNDRIVVANGTYDERITVDKSVDVFAVTPGGVILEDPGDYGPVIRIEDDAAPTIDGLRIGGLRTGNISSAVAISAPGTSGDWTVRNLTVSDADVGINALGSTGDWTVEQSRFSAIVFNGILATGSNGDWTVQQTAIRNGQGSAGDGITAGDTSGNWTIRDVVIADQESEGISVQSADGDPRITRSVIRSNGAAGVDADTSTSLRVRRTVVVNNNGTGIDLRDATGEHVINGSIISGNSGAGVNATGASPTVDATNNWWGPGSTPDVGQCVGNVNCSEALSTAPSIPDPSSGADLVVAPDESGDFTSIQDAIDAADDGDTIRIRAGLYTYDNSTGNQALTVDKNVTIDGAGNVTIAGPSRSLDSPLGAAITIDSGAAPVIENVSIRTFPVGVNARGTDRDWELHNVSVTNTFVAVNAYQTTGNWRISESRVAANEGGVFASNVSTGAGRIERTTVTNNTNFGINATSSGVTIDATGNWWGQADGPTASQCIGNVNCSAPLSAPPDVDIVVAADGSGDFTSIQAAIDAASDDATIVVSTGTYEEVRIEVTKNVTISGEPGATVVGEGPNAGEYTTLPAFVVPRDLNSSVAPTIEGITLSQHVTGFQFIGSSGDWVVRDVVIEDTRLGISASRSAGDWVVENLSHAPPERHFFAGGITASGSTGNWRITQFNTTRLNASVDARDATGDWMVSNSNFSDTGLGVNAESATGQWRVQETSVVASRDYRFADEVVGIGAVETTGAWRISNTTIESAEVAIDLTPASYRFTDPASGNWTVAESKLVKNEVAIRANSISGSWAVTQSTITDNAIGIDATDANRTGDATTNWWGQPSGATESQCVGNVTCSDPLSSPSGGDTERFTG